MFESTIRYVGGLLSAYELSGKKHEILVSKARELADKLTLAWGIVSGRNYSHPLNASLTSVVVARRTR